eukprot:gene64343-87999_t
MALGFLVAIPLAILRWRQVTVVSQLIDGYSILVRGIPGLLVIYLLFFGSIDWVRTVTTAFGYQDSADDAYPYIVGVIAIAVIACAYSIEVMRGALQSVPRGPLEAAQALALPGRVAFLLITLPLALRLALGGINNVWQMTIKDTSLKADSRAGRPVLAISACRRRKRASPSAPIREGPIPEKTAVSAASFRLIAPASSLRPTASA